MSNQPYCHYPQCGCPNKKSKADCFKGYPLKGSMTAPSETLQPWCDCATRYGSRDVTYYCHPKEGFKCRKPNNLAFAIKTSSRIAELETTLTESRAECERLRAQCQEEIRLRSEAATRAIAAETECERLREQLAAKERDRHYHMDAINRLAAFLAISGTSFEVIQAAMDNMTRMVAECERLRVRCVEEIRLRDEAARRAVTAETREREAYERAANVVQGALIACDAGDFGDPEYSRAYIEETIATIRALADRGRETAMDKAKGILP